MDDHGVISIILPVYHEADGIHDVLAHLRGLGPGGPIEVIVVDGDPAQSTIKVVRDKSIITATSAQGRAVQMNRGADLASGEILLFLHADTFLPVNAFLSIRECMQNDRIVAGAFDLGIRTDRKIFRITERYVAIRTRLTRIPFGDQGIFIRRDYFRMIGGYQNIAIMEDVELMRRIRRRGDAICVIPEKIMTSPRRWEKEGVLYSTFRNWMLQLLYLFGVPPERLARFYKS